MTVREPIARWRWNTVLDNHTPARSYAHGEAVEYAADDVRYHTFTLVGLDTVKDAYHAVYILDFGTRVEAWYVAGWNPLDTEKKIFIHPMPCNPDSQVRPDNGRVIDYTTWVLGPRRAFHLKMTPEV